MYPDRSKTLNLETWVDTDYAGDRESRKSVGCSVVILAGSLIHFHSRQQTVVATSSAEAEYYGIAAGLLETIGVKNTLSELGVEHRTSLFCDSSSARSLALKKGFGRCKHVDVKMAWVQEAIGQNGVSLRPIKSDDNVADIGTKSLGENRIRLLSEKLSLMDSGHDVMMVQIYDQAQASASTLGEDEGAGAFWFWPTLLFGSLSLNLVGCFVLPETKDTTSDSAAWS